MPTLTASAATAPTRTLRATLAAAAICAALGLFGFASGCSKDVRSESLVLPMPEAPRPLAIDVEVFRGDVVVRVDKTRKDVGVWTDVAAVSDVPDEDKAEVDRAVTTTSLIEDRGGIPTLVVRAATARTGEDHRADVLVRVPTCEGVRVRTGLGEVILVGVKGELRVESGGGVVEVRTNQPLTSPVSIDTKEGNIYYQGPFECTGVFDVRTDEGEAIWRGWVGGGAASTLVYSKGGYTVTLNNGQNPVSIHTGKGDPSVILLEDAQSRVRTVR